MLIFYHNQIEIKIEALHSFWSAMIYLTAESIFEWQMQNADRTERKFNRK